jgi:nucleoid-associated protein YgaU
MKKILLAIAVAFIAVPVMAQVVDPNKPDAELTKEEAQIRITEWQNKVNDLKTKLDGLNNTVSTMNTQMTQIAADTKRCNDELYALVGATDADVQNFRERLGRIESRTREMGRMSDDQRRTMLKEIDTLEMSLNGMRGEKISLLPEFYNKIIDLARDIKALRPGKGASNTYTVGTWQKDRDCLWNISGKSEIYGDPMMWPKIWQANTDKIRNPDIIHPGQELSIPPAGPKTDEELRAERLYYRRKHMATRRVATQRSQQVEQQEAGSGGH